VSKVIPGLLLAAFLCTLGGCLSRKLIVTSEPSGARVWANDVELGETPLEAEFTYYGAYDVRVTKDGYEPIRTVVPVNAPFYEYPGPDIIANVIPGGIEHDVKWNFKLGPALERSLDKAAFEQGILERAKALRGKIQ
jgi:hypothetical protein